MRFCGCPESPEGIGCPGPGPGVGCGLPNPECQKLNWGLLQEQQMLLLNKSSLWPGNLEVLGGELSFL